MNKNLKLLIISFLVFIAGTFNLFASTSPQRLMSVIDYINGDYHKAVGTDYKVLSDFEYSEMKEFTQSAVNIQKSLNTGSKRSEGITRDLLELEKKVDQKAPPEEIKNLISGIKQNIIVAYNVRSYPGNSPDISHGETVYNRNCSSCHGYNGQGNGTLAPNLDPTPADFTNPEVKASLSPYKVYNTISFGVNGTSMPAFKSLSDGEKWDAAFYVLSLGFPGNPSGKNGDSKKIPSALTDYRNLATLTNSELDKKIESEDLGDSSSLLGYLRTDLLKDAHVPDSPFEYTSKNLDAALVFYKNEKFEEALNSSIDAYLNGYETVEKDLLVKNQQLTTELEGKLTSFRSGIKERIPYDQLASMKKDISADLDRASLVYSDTDSLGSAVLYTNSLSIFLREALEAILIIAAIIAYLSRTGSKAEIKYIHYGWIAAIIAGLVTWFLARTIITISGASREVIEGITALAAAAVLFYVSYWLISKIEVEKWKHYIKTRVQTAVNKKSVFALVAVSFLAVYREAFETVLFYQALLYQAEKSVSPVIWGFLTALVLTVIIIYFIFKLALRIPLKYFFSVTSMFLYILCFILVGKGLHELQGAGLLDITHLENFPKFEHLGVYPTLETAAPQGVILLAVLFALFWIVYVTRASEKQELAKSLSQLTNEMQTMHHSFDHIKGHILEWRKCDEIDLEAEELEHEIQDVIQHVNQLQSKIGNFYEVVTSKSK